MVSCITPPQTRVTVAPAGHHVALTVASLRPAICTLSPSQAKALAGDLLDVAGVSCDLVTVRPGPVLHLWRDGQEAGRVTLSTGAALALLASLAKAIEGAGHDLR
ncbi:hypothetical protein [Roseinatronobacter sp.]|uniref:hypothetical protein n=1 Tax=Roseinatronobacter sp. TaxID=1945755 RepID=UPI0025D5CD76|nr:hypothetical protein [Roseibaca sp.]